MKRFSVFVNVGNVTTLPKALTLAMLAVVLVLGLAFVGCKSVTDETTPSFEGTWRLTAATGTVTTLTFAGNRISYAGNYSGNNLPFSYTATTVTIRIGENDRTFEYTLSGNTLTVVRWLTPAPFPAGTYQKQ